MTGPVLTPGGGPIRDAARRIRHLLVMTPAVILMMTIAPPGVYASPDASEQVAQPTGGARIDVTGVSPWVGSDGDFRVELRVTGTVPTDAVVRTSIHQRLRPRARGTLRDSLDAVLDGAAVPAVIQAPTTRPLAELGDPLVGVVIDIPVRSSRSQPDDRVLLPSPGIHPVTIDVLDTAGTQLTTTTVFLNHLPAPPATAATVAAKMPVALTTVVDGPPAIDPEGRARLSTEARHALESITALLTAIPRAPITVAIRPTLLSGLAGSTDPGDRRLLQALQDTWRSLDHAYIAARMPEVAVDTGGLATTTGGEGELLRQVALGDQTVRTILGAEPSTATWLGDPTVTTASLGLLQGLGTRRLIIGTDRLRATGRGADESSLTSRVSELSPTPVTTTAPDAAITQRLTAEGVPVGIRANQATTALMASWFASLETPGDFVVPVAVVAIPAAIEPAVLQAFLPAFASPGPLTADPTLVPATSTDAAGRMLTAQLNARSVPDQGPAVRSVVETRRLIDGFRSLAPAATTQLTEWELLDAQTLDRNMSVGDRSAYHVRIRGSITASASQIELPKPRRVMLTSRRSTIPLRFRNGLPYDVTILLRTRSNRLDIGGGPERSVVLHPGENRIDLPVTTRAGGGTFLRVSATSPDGSLVLGSVAIPVTSTTISGAGAVLSVLSLLVLAAWWLRTLRRGRIERRRERTARRRQVVGQARHPLEDNEGVEEPPEGEPTPSTGTDSVISGG